MKNLTLDQHRKRIANINSAEASNKKYFRRHRIRDYIPGQAIYHLGDYPNPFSISPTEYDRELIKSFSKNGVGLIQIHEDWNDSIRRLGADKLTSHDPDGLRKFVDLCHEFGIKIIPYISTGYFQATDPDFKDEFTRIDHSLRGDYFAYKKCWAGSAEWREYILPRTFAALDEYGFDGIYNDWGYDGLTIFRRKLIAEGKNLDGVTSYDMPYDPEIEDLLSTVYSEVKRRGGIYKLHADVNNKPPCKDKVYDYLWIGENVRDDAELGIGKEYEQYIVPCRHGAHSTESPESYYARTIPFMQFPLLKKGRRFIPKEIDEALIVNPNYSDYKHKARVMEYMKEHPNGPYVHSLWSDVPEDENEYSVWSKYLALYQPMVEENSVAYIEISESEDVLSPILSRIAVSMFVNEETYLVVSNFSGADYTLDLRGIWQNRENGDKGSSFTVKNGSVIFLVRA